MTMDTTTIIFQLVALFTFLGAAVMMNANRSEVVEPSTRIAITALFVLIAFVTFFNVGPRLHLLRGIERYEGYLEILIFPLALFALYSIRKDLDHHALKKSRLDDQTKAVLLDSVSDAIVLHDASGNIRYVNETLARLTGFSPQALKHMNLSQIVPEDTVSALPLLFESVQSKHSDTFELAVSAAANKRIPVEVSARTFSLEGKAHILSVVRDISERKQMEHERDEMMTRLRQAEKMESLGTLAGGIAHDFNNILVPIIGYSDMLSESFDPSSKYHDLSDKILNAAERARDIVQQILAFSRAGRESESAHPVFVHLILKEVLVLVKEVMPSSATLQTRISSCPPVVSTPSNIHRLCLNLITNAWQALEKQNGTVTIELKETTPPRDVVSVFPQWVHLSVSDTGKGMTEEQIARIFEPYFTTKPEGFGTGLGLSVVDGIVQGVQGKIRVESIPGKGTTFTVLLPGAEEIQLKKPLTTQHSLAPGSGHVLVVDDEPMVGEYIREILERAGYRVSLFQRSPEALAAISRNSDNWDLVISDYTMPEMTGDVLAAKVRQQNPNIGFILCSGYSGQLSNERYTELGINGFILKPLRPQELLGKIEKVLLKKRGEIDL